MVRNAGWIAQVKHSALITLIIVSVIYKKLRLIVTADKDATL